MTQLIGRARVRPSTAALRRPAPDQVSTGVQRGTGRPADDGGQPEIGSEEVADGTKAMLISATQTIQARAILLRCGQSFLR